MSEIKVERTGKIFSMTSSEYLITFSDGSQETIWSPVWYDWNKEQEDEEALKLAKKLWTNKEILEKFVSNCGFKVEKMKKCDIVSDGKLKEYKSR